MFKNRKFALPALLLALALVLGGCNSTAAPSGGAESAKPSGGASSGEYVIGFAGPLSGASAQDGVSGLEGVKVALDQINKAGGIGGVMLRVSEQDDKGDPKEASLVANKLAQDQSVLAVVGNFNSSCTLAGAPIYNQAGVSQIAFGSTSPAVTDAGAYTYRTIPSDEIGGRYSAKWAFDNIDIKKAAIVYENTDYGLGIAEIFKEECETRGVEVIAYENYMPGETTDFNTMATKIKEGAPDVIFLGSLYNEAALFAKQAQRLGVSLPMVGVDALYSYPLIELGGDAVEGLTFSAFYTSENPDPDVQAFITAYGEMFGGKVPSTYAAYAYDATMCIVEAIKANGADRAKINEFLTTLKDLKGVSGVNTFDENGDVVKDPLMVQVKDGTFAVIS